MLPEVRLDTDSFKALIEEYRMQIAGIYPEWTNYNYSDPGMTLVELFAWMKENQQFFMEQLSPEHYKSFFRLMGIRPQSMLPAQVMACVDSEIASEDEVIPGGTVYYSEDIPYSTVLDNCIPKARICGIKAGAFVTEDELDIAGTANIYPFGKEPKSGNAMEIYLDNPLPLDVECFLCMIISDNPKRNPKEGFMFQQLTKLRFEYFSVDGWKEIENVIDNTQGLLFTGRIGMTVSQPMAEIEAGRYAIRITLREGSYDRVPFIKNMGYHFLRLVQIKEADCCFVTGGVSLGEGNGFPSQRVKLPYESILSYSVEIDVEDILNPGVMKHWRRVNDFSMEGPSSECYMVDAETGEIVFGDGKRGLPPEGRIALTKAMLSLGFDGTAMDGAELRCPGKQPLKVLSTMVIGRDNETIEEIKARIKKGKENMAISTAADYEAQVLKTPGMVIHSCRVLERQSSPTKVTIAVRPGDGKEQLKLSKEMETNIFRHLDRRRLIGTDIRIMSPEYIRVGINLAVAPADQYKDIEGKIKEAVCDYFENYGSFGDYIVYGKLYGIIDSLDCVKKVYSIDLEADKVSVIKSRSGDLIPPPNGLFLFGGVEILF